MLKICAVALILLCGVFASAQTRQPSTTEKKLVIIRSDEIVKARDALKPNDRKDFLTEGGLYSQFWIQFEQNKVGEAEIHDSSDDYHIILEGSATYIVGGKLVEPKELKNRPGEWRAARIEGGERVTLNKGDVMFVPRGLAHQRDTTGQSSKYLLIKIHSNPVEAPKPKTHQPAQKQ